MPGGISAARMDEAMRALADPTRREILRLVHEDELAAGLLRSAAASASGI